MGGDGGVIASNRRYMRGAGNADHTGDFQRHNASSSEKVKFDAHETMTTCALTKAPLLLNSNSNDGNNSSSMIVSDSYGQLYHKEVAVKALLKRKQQLNEQQRPDTTIGPHVRRLNDLYDVRFCHDDVSSITANDDNDTAGTIYTKDMRTSVIPICPITGKALTGSIAAILLVPGKSDKPNCVSESALKQLSSKEIQEEFGIITKKIRLAPPPILLEKIKEEVQKEHDEDEERQRKKKKKKSKTKLKKRKRDHRIDEEKCEKKNDNGIYSNGNSNSKRSSICTNEERKKTSSSVGKEIQSRVDSAIKRNSVLSSIFTKKEKKSNISEKEKKDNLFAR